MAEVLVQTRLPQQAADWIARAAETAGLSVAGWVRSVLLSVATGTRTDAWVVRPSERVARLHGAPPKPHMTLQLLSRGPALSVFTILHPPTHPHAGEPWSEHWFKDNNDLFTNQHERALVLRGSPSRWSIIHSLFDSGAQRVELALEALLDSDGPGSSHAPWLCEHGSSDVLELAAEPPRVQWCMECGCARRETVEDDGYEWGSWEKPAALGRSGVALASERGEHADDRGAP